MSAVVYNNINMRAYRETMPQMVPSSAGPSPSFDFSHFAADSFDLSLLPSPDDCEVPYSPLSFHQVLSAFNDPTVSPPPMFHPNNPFEEDLLHGKSSDPPPYSYQQIKEEPFSPYMVGNSNSATCLGASYMNAPMSVSPMPQSPSGSTYSSVPSPCHPPSPVRTPPIKQEQTIDLQEILKESKLLQESIGNFSSCTETQIGKDIETPSIVKIEAAECSEKPKDHQLLREVLRDTSFQKKLNIKPLDIEGLTSHFRMPEIKVEADEQSVSSGTSSTVPTDEVSSGTKGLINDVDLSGENIEPVLSLAFEHLRKDVDNTCSVLGIASDPGQWTTDDVKAWLLWTLRQYDLPMISVENFNIDGATLSSLSEEEFQQRAPQCGSTLHAQLEIWKAACAELESHIMQWSNSNKSCSSSGGDPSDDEDEDFEASPPSAGATGTPGKPTRGGSHIHLWQFLKELLASPQVHGSCIRWLERNKGVFKIEDSVRVARLWGKRKNRPAMNYDKLSRSIRQYYKKGIMKKTERSQRLVYQFCHPYCL